MELQYTITCTLMRQHSCLVGAIAALQLHVCAEFHILSSQPCRFSSVFSGLLWPPKKHAVRWRWYSKWSICVNMCYHDVLRWISFPSSAYSYLGPSVLSWLWIHHDPDQKCLLKKNERKRVLSSNFNTWEPFCCNFYPILLVYFETISAVMSAQNLPKFICYHICKFSMRFHYRFFG